MLGFLRLKSVYERYQHKLKTQSYGSVKMTYLNSNHSRVIDEMRAHAESITSDNNQLRISLEHLKETQIQSALKKLQLVMTNLEQILKTRRLKNKLWAFGSMKEVYLTQIRMRRNLIPKIGGIKLLVIILSKKLSLNKRRIIEEMRIYCDEEKEKEKKNTKRNGLNILSSISRTINIRRLGYYLAKWKMHNLEILTTESNMEELIDVVSRRRDICSKYKFFYLLKNDYREFKRLEAEDRKDMEERITTFGHLLNVVWNSANIRLKGFAFRGIQELSLIRTIQSSLFTQTSQGIILQFPSSLNTSLSQSPTAQLYNIQKEITLLKSTAHNSKLNSFRRLFRLLKTFYTRAAIYKIFTYSRQLHKIQSQSTDALHLRRKVEYFHHLRAYAAIQRQNKLLNRMATISDLLQEKYIRELKFGALSKFYTNMSTQRKAQIVSDLHKKYTIKQAFDELFKNKLQRKRVTKFYLSILQIRGKFCRRIIMQRALKKFQKHSRFSKISADISKIYHKFKRIHALNALKDRVKIFNFKRELCLQMLNINQTFVIRQRKIKGIQKFRNNLKLFRKAKKINRISEKIFKRIAIERLTNYKCSVIKIESIHMLMQINKNLTGKSNITQKTRGLRKLFQNNTRIKLKGAELLKILRRLNIFKVLKKFKLNVIKYNKLDSCKALLKIKETIRQRSIKYFKSQGIERFSANSIYTHKRITKLKNLQNLLNKKEKRIGLKRFIKNKNWILNVAKLYTKITRKLHKRRLEHTLNIWKSMTSQSKTREKLYIINNLSRLLVLGKLIAKYRQPSTFYNIKW